MPALRISSTNARASTLNSLLPAGSSMVSRIALARRDRARRRRRCRGSRPPRAARWRARDRTRGGGDVVRRCGGPPIGRARSLCSSPEKRLRSHSIAIARRKRASDSGCVRVFDGQERIAARRQPVERRPAVQRRRLDLLRVVHVEHARQHVDLAAPRSVERAHGVAVGVEDDLVDARRRAPVVGARAPGGCACPAPSPRTGTGPVPIGARAIGADSPRAPRMM